MINKYEKKGDVVEMVVSDKLVLFDLEDFSKLDRFNQWKLSRGKSVVTDYRKGDQMMRVTLHNLLVGSKFVKWLNGNIFDFRKDNITPVAKSIRPRACGVTLKGNECKVDGNAIIMSIICKGNKYDVHFNYDDYPLVSKYTWYINPASGYVQTKARLGRAVNKGMYMHRLLMGADGRETYVDHINGNKLDNRRNNLRICSPSENGHNKHAKTSKVIGVNRHIIAYWEARINVKGKPYVKRFKTYEEALAQRRAWEQEFNPSGLNGDSK